MDNCHKTQTSIHFQIFDQQYVTEQTLGSLTSNPIGSGSMNSKDKILQQTNSQSSIDNDFIYSATNTYDNVSIFDPCSPPAKQQMKRSQDDTLIQYNQLLKQYQKIQENLTKSKSEQTQLQEKIQKLTQALQEKENIIQKQEHQIKLFKHSLIDYECNKLKEAKQAQIQQMELQSKLKMLQELNQQLQIKSQIQSEKISNLETIINEQQIQIKQLESKPVQALLDQSSILFKSTDDHIISIKSDQQIDIFAEKKTPSQKKIKLDHTLSEIKKNSEQNDSMMKMQIQFFKEFSNAQLDKETISTIHQQLTLIYDKQQQYLQFLLKQLQNTQNEKKLQLFESPFIQKSSSNLSNQESSIRLQKIQILSDIFKQNDQVQKRNSNEFQQKINTEKTINSKYQKKTSALYSFNPLELKIIKKDNSILSGPKSSETLKFNKSNIK